MNHPASDSLFARAPAEPTTPAKPGRAARAVLGLLERLDGDAVALHRQGEVRVYGRPCAGATVPIVQIHDDAVFARTLAAGDVGFAEAYLEGQWDTPDLTALLTVLVRQRGVLAEAVYGRFWGRLLDRLRHLMNRNTRAGSRRNIHAHYDLGNAFYRLWLDRTMNYSSAWWGDAPGLTLVEAQERKVARALDEAGVARGRRVLEIGCGWGAAAEAAARRGAHCTGLTLSHEQLDFARRRLDKAGLAGHTDLRLMDYRDLPASGERYDAIVSIEMFEAVGESYWPGYFHVLREALKPGGRACLQTITIDESLFATYRRGTDFIQQYVFPGGMLPSAEAFRAQAQRAGLRVVGELRFGADYARTLNAWHARFNAEAEAVRALGFGERFTRLWRFYLAYCEAAFATGQTDVRQFTLEAA